MALSTSRLVVVVTLAVLVIASLIKPSVSTSRNAFHVHRRKSLMSRSVDGFRVELRRVDNAKNLTKFERIQRAVMRGKHRLEQLSLTTSTLKAAAAAGNTAIRAPIHPGDGEFLMSLSIGTPPVHLSAIVDTGSDLIWTQCKPCVQCYNQPTPIFNPSNSSSFSKLPCTSPLCSSLPLPSCSDSDPSSASAFCTYTYEYGDYSTTSGTLASDTFTFSSSLSIPSIGFGCGDDNEGGGFSQGSGLIGLGRGPLSLVSQLKITKFSYCLTSINANDDAGTLLMGSLSDVALTNSTNSPLVTPLARNPNQPSFYYMNLNGVSVGGVRLQISPSVFALKEDGSGGMIIDSGTTITYLEESAFAELRREFLNGTTMEVADDAVTIKTGLDLCFKMGNGTVELEVPSVVFHFEGADLRLPAENYMVRVSGEDGAEMVCLAMGSASGMSVFGNIQQQNMMVVHDLKAQSLTFLPANCHAL